MGTAAGAATVAGVGRWTAKAAGAVAGTAAVAGVAVKVEARPKVQAHRGGAGLSGWHPYAGEWWWRSYMEQWHQELEEKERRRKRRQSKEDDERRFQESLTRVKASQARAQEEAKQKAAQDSAAMRRLGPAMGRIHGALQQAADRRVDDERAQELAETRRLQAIARDSRQRLSRRIESGMLALQRQGWKLK